MKVWPFLVMPMLFTACATSDIVADNSETLLSCETHKIVKDGRKIFVVDHDLNKTVDTKFKEFISTDDVVNAMHIRHKLNCNYPLTFRTFDDRIGSIMPDGTLFGGRLFENSYDIYGGTKWVSDDKLFGLIDISGQYLIEPKYEKVSFGRYKQEHLYFAHSDENIDILRLDGSPLDITMDQYNRYQALSCDEDLIRYSEDGKWGLKHENGDILINAKYEALSCPINKLIYAPSMDDNAWCVVDKDGWLVADNISCKPEFYPELGHHVVPEKFDDDPFTSNVLWRRAYLEYGEGQREERPKITGDGYWSRASQ